MRVARGQSEQTAAPSRRGYGRPLTCTGVSLSVAVPLPTLEPQQSIAPLSSSVHADSPPTETAVAFVIPLTATGVALSMVMVPLPS